MAHWKGRKGAESMAEDKESTELGKTKVNVEFPDRTIAALDKEADRIGIARQALIKYWIDEQLRERGLL